MEKHELRALRVESIGDLKGLDTNEIRYLAERDRIPSAVKAQLIDSGRLDLSDLANESVDTADRANTGDVRNMSTDELEALLEQRRADEEENPNREAPDPHFEDVDPPAKPKSAKKEKKEKEKAKTTKSAAKKTSAPAKKAASAKDAASDDESNDGEDADGDSDSSDDGDDGEKE